MITLQLPQDSKAKSIGLQQNLMRRPLPLAPDVISAEASIAKISFHKEKKVEASNDIVIKQEENDTYENFVYLGSLASK